MVSSSPMFLIPTCLALAAAASLSPILAFQTPSSTSAISSVTVSRSKNNRQVLELNSNHDDNNTEGNIMPSSSRRSAIATAISSFLILPTVAFAEESQPNLQKYDDFTTASEGWSYKDVKIGDKEFGGGDLKDGDRVVFDWSGYTIGYFGRPFEAKGGPQGGAFDKDVNYFRTILGSKTLIPGLECALRDMRPGSIRQVIVPYGPLSYPPDDKEHELVGPKPTTFSGMRALNFVLENPRVDRTMLFNVKLIRVDRSDGKGGFIRG